MNHSENQPLLKILLFIPFQHCGCRYDSPYMLGLLHICVYAARTLKGYHENQSKNFRYKLFNPLAETFIFKKFIVKELKSLMPIFFSHSNHI